MIIESANFLLFIYIHAPYILISIVIHFNDTIRHAYCQFVFKILCNALITPYNLFFFS